MIVPTCHHEGDHYTRRGSRYAYNRVTPTPEQVALLVGRAGDEYVEVRAGLTLANAKQTAARMRRELGPDYIVVVQEQTPNDGVFSVRVRRRTDDEPRVRGHKLVPDENWTTIPDAARQAGVPVWTFRRDYVDTGLIRVYRFGRVCGIRRAHVDKVLGNTPTVRPPGGLIVAAAVPHSRDRELPTTTERNRA